jgi:type I restriction enzyme, S subunit
LSNSLISMPLGEIPTVTGNGINPYDFREEEFELYSVPAHESGKPEIVFGVDIGSNKQIVSEGMVLLCKINPRINRVWVVKSSRGRRQIASTEWITFGQNEFILPKYLAHFLSQAEVRDFLAANASGVGGSLMRVKASTLANYDFKLSGRKTQARIVAKLEELLSGLDAGVGELKAAQKKLQQYRQTLLKAAVEGQLTAPWRKEQRKLRIPNETAVQLLERILTERRMRWKAEQLSKFKKQGKAPPKDWQKKYLEPVQPDTIGLPALPDGWLWVSLDAFIVDGPQNGLYLPSSKYGSGTPILRIDDYQIGWHRERAALNSVEASSGEVQTYALASGDLVINRVNSMTHLGKSLLVSIQLGGVLFESNMMRLGLSTLVSGELVAHYLGSDIGRARLITHAKWAVNQASINQQDVRRTPIPLMPIAEQQEIARLVDLQLMAAVNQDAAIARGLEQSIAQRQNILRAAFAGQLVPQDPNDEPANVLLERIRAERAERAKQPKAHKSKQQKEIAAVVSKLSDVLAEAGDWVPAQEAFRRCGVVDGAQTDQIEALYTELRALDKAGRLAVEPVADAKGRKLYDKLKLVVA